MCWMTIRGRSNDMEVDQLPPRYRGEPAYKRTRFVKNPSTSSRSYVGSYYSDDSSSLSIPGAAYPPVHPAMSYPQPALMPRVLPVSPAYGFGAPGANGFGQRYLPQPQQRAIMPQDFEPEYLYSDSSDGGGGGGGQMGAQGFGPEVYGLPQNQQQQQRLLEQRQGPQFGLPANRTHFFPGRGDFDQFNPQQQFQFNDQRQQGIPVMAHRRNGRSTFVEDGHNNRRRNQNRHNEY